MLGVSEDMMMMSLRKIARGGVVMMVKGLVPDRCSARAGDAIMGDGPPLKRAKMLTIEAGRACDVHACDACVHPPTAPLLPP